MRIMRADKSVKSSARSKVKHIIITLFAFLGEAIPVKWLAIFILRVDFPNAKESGGSVGVACSGVHSLVRADCGHKAAI
jgi:hypothetical protein